MRHVRTRAGVRAAIRADHPRAEQPRGLTAQVRLARMDRAGDIPRATRASVDR